MNSGPLSRFRVIDLTRIRSGPTAVRQFADWGAEVVKVETPEDDTGLSSRDNSDFQNLHRNKRSLTLNLKEPAGRDVLLKLVESADVLVENYRPDVKNRLGIDYETLAKINPRLVYGSISGFGQDGPYANRPGFDQVAQGMGGLMSVTGLPGQGPVRAGIPVADLGAGLYCAHRHPHRAAGAGGFRAGPVGSVLPSPGAGVAAGLPGGALADGQACARAGGQRSPHLDADGRVRDLGRLRQHRGRRPAHVAELLRSRRARGPCGRSPLRHRDGPHQTPRGAEPDHRPDPRARSRRPTGSRR